MHHYLVAVISIVLTGLFLGGCEAITGATDAANPEAPVSTQNAAAPPGISLSEDDILAIQSAIGTTQMKQSLELEGLEDIWFSWKDGNGDTCLDMLFAERMIAAVQRDTPAEQTKFLKDLHSSFYEALHSPEKPSPGLFGSHVARDGAMRDAILKRSAALTADQLVLTVGFEKDDENFVYATVRGDNVTFDENCPKASSGGW